MPLYLRGKKWILPQEITEDDEQIAEQLFAEAQALPVAEKNLEDLEQLSEPFNQEEARGVMEEWYIVVTDHSVASAIYTDRIHIGGTGGLDSCFSLSFYDGVLHQVAIVHIDLRIDINSLDNVLHEFTSSKYLAVRMFGGTYQMGDTISDDYLCSLKLAKQIYLYLYKKTKNGLLDIDIRSTNTFEKLKAYKAYQLQKNGDLTVGFAINACNGKVIAEFSEHFQQWLPYVQVKNCGIFQDATKRGAIGINLRYYLKLPPKQLVKQYDGNRPDYERKLYENWAEKSVQGIIDILLERLRDLHLATHIPNLDNELITYINTCLPQWKELYAKETSYLDDLLQYIVMEFYQKRVKQLEPHPYSPEVVTNFFINRLLNAKVIQQWCYRKVHADIAAIIFDKISFAVNKKYFIEQLKTINSLGHLMEELTQYKIYNFNLTEGGFSSKEQEKNLVFTLLKATNQESLGELIKNWFMQKIDSEILSYISNNIMKQISQTTSKRLTESEIIIFNKWLNEKLLPHKRLLLPHLHFDAEHSAALKQMVKAMAEEIVHNFPCSPCYGSTLNERILIRLEEMIDKWLNTIKIVNAESSGHNPDKEEEVTENEESYFPLIN